VLQCLLRKRQPVSRRDDMGLGIEIPLKLLHFNILVARYKRSNGKEPYCDLLKVVARWRPSTLE